MRTMKLASRLSPASWSAAHTRSGISGLASSASSGRSMRKPRRWLNAKSSPSHEARTLRAISSSARLAASSSSFTSESCESSPRSEAGTSRPLTLRSNRSEKCLQKASWMSVRFSRACARASRYAFCDSRSGDFSARSKRSSSMWSSIAASDLPMRSTARLLQSEIICDDCWRESRPFALRWSPMATKFALWACVIAAPPSWPSRFRGAMPFRPVILRHHLSVALPFFSESCVLHLPDCICNRRGSMPPVGPLRPRVAYTPGMTILVCGSMAYDTIMVFPDQFRKHILPDQIHILNVAFMVPDMRREYGGTGGNIAYNLRLLGESPALMATVGHDFGPYRSRLGELGISARHVRRLDDQFTAQAFITTDIDDNQITAFHPGAMSFAHLNRVSDAPAARLGIVSPGGRQGMIEHAHGFAAAGIPYVFD